MHKKQINFSHPYFCCIWGYSYDALKLSLMFSFGNNTAEPQRSTLLALSYRKQSPGCGQCLPVIQKLESTELAFYVDSRTNLNFHSSFFFCSWFFFWIKMSFLPNFHFYLCSFLQLQGLIWWCNRKNEKCVRKARQVGVYIETGFKWVWEVGLTEKVVCEQKPNNGARGLM